MQQLAQKETNGNPVLSNLTVAYKDRLIQLSDLIDRINRVGHKLQDTNTPEKPSPSEQQPSSGVIFDFVLCNERFDFLNDRLLQIAIKMEEII